ncbi:unnamed protein product, partial [Dovyalis caffra]
FLHGSVQATEITEEMVHQESPSKVKIVLCTNDDESSSASSAEDVLHSRRWKKNKVKKEGEGHAGSIQATKITEEMAHHESKILIRLCDDDKGCIPYCPKTCKRVYCDKRPEPKQSRCFCETSEFSLKSMLFTMPCVQG